MSTLPHSHTPTVTHKAEESLTSDLKTDPVELVSERLISVLNFKESYQQEDSELKSYAGT